MARYGREFRQGGRNRRPYFRSAAGYHGPEYQREPSRPYPHPSESDFDAERYDLEYSGRGWGFGIGYEDGMREDVAHHGRSRGRGRPGGSAAGYGSEFAGGYGQDYGRGDAGWERGGGGRADYDRGGYGRSERAGHTPSGRWPERQSAGRRDHMSDDEVRVEVQESLFQDSWIEPDRIEVEVEDGIVTLKGEVRDFMEARYAWDDVWETPGVRGVINQLTVRPDGEGDAALPQTAGEQDDETRGSGGKR
jgi:hypothetical protein